MKRADIITYQGEEMTLSEAVRRSGTAVSINTIEWRLSQGWPLQLALFRPVTKTGARGGALVSLRPAREWGSL